MLISTEQCDNVVCIQQRSYNSQIQKSVEYARIRYLGTYLL